MSRPVSCSWVGSLFLPVHVVECGNATGRQNTLWKGSNVRLSQKGPGKPGGLPLSREQWSHTSNGRLGSRTASWRSWQVVNRRRTQEEFPKLLRGRTTRLGMMETRSPRELDCRWEVTELVSGSTEDWSTQVSRSAWGPRVPGWAQIRGRPELLGPGHGPPLLPTGANSCGSTCAIYTGKQRVFRSFPGPNPTCVLWDGGLLRLCTCPFPSLWVWKLQR